MVFLAGFRDLGYFCTVIVLLLNLVHQTTRLGVYRQGPSMRRALVVSHDATLPLDGFLMDSLEHLIN